MIVNNDRNINLSLYYLGAIIIKILMTEDGLTIDMLMRKLEEYLGEKIHINFLYYSLDWLFLLSVVKIEDGKIYYENKTVKSL